MKICLRNLGIWTTCAVIYWQCSDFVATAEEVLRGRKNQGNKVGKEWGDAASLHPLCLALFFLTSFDTNYTVPLCWALYCLYHELAGTENFQPFVIFRSLQLPLLVERKQSPDVALMGGVFPSPFCLQPSQNSHLSFGHQFFKGKLC